MEKESKARAALVRPGIGDVTDDYLLQRVSGSLTARGKAGTGICQQSGRKVHEAVPRSRRPYEHYDPAAMEQAMADFLNRPVLLEGRDEEVLRPYDAIVDEYDRLAT